MSKKLITIDEAAQGKAQHQQACSDCPMRRDSLAGWLGGSSSDEYAHLAHSDQVVDCHAIRNTQCAGLAIYRRNVCKSAPVPNLKLESNHQVVFSSRQEFLNHHNRVLVQI